MCGICGILSLTGEPPDRGRLGRMNDALRHRGPDGEGFLIDGPVGLAMRRLAIIDLATGDQPQFGEDRSVGVVFNGEIYNYRELRDGLERRGHRFVTRSDTETIPHLYEEAGPDCARSLNGIFGIAIWDAPRQQLTLIRDHLGIKPIYYARTDRALVFASEIKALRHHPGIDWSIDPIALDQYLAFRYIPAPRTIYQGVRKLPAGHRLIARPDSFAVERYWDVEYPADGSGDDSVPAADWAARVRDQVERSIRAQLVSDVPIGAFLSGGIDSSIVAGVMSQASDRPVKTYSVGFPGWQDHDEIRFARIAAERFGTDHHEVEVDARAADLLPRLVDQFDEPFADPAALPTYLIAREARRELTVVLTGEGADELFGGYGWYGWRRRLSLPLPGPVRTAARDLVATAMHGRRGRSTLTAIFCGSARERYLETVATSVLTTPDRRRLYNRDLAAAIDGAGIADGFGSVLDRADRLGPRAAMQYLDTKIWLEGDPLTKVDRTTMAVSLEARVPFLDLPLVELAAQIPPELHVRGTRSKALLRQAFADLLPEPIRNRPKHAFEVPVAAWLRTDLRDLVTDLLGPAAPLVRRFFDADRVGALVEPHLAGRRNFGRELWTLLCLAIWYERQPT